jgi:tRNA uridine 5-carbamoylmethylation protein Kti12
VEIVAVEAAPDALRARNRARDHAVPDAVIDRLVSRWETPDPTEAAGSSPSFASEQCAHLWVVAGN